MTKTIRFMNFIGFLLILSVFVVSNISAQDKTEKNTTENTQTITEAVQINKPVERYRIGLLDVIDVVISRHPELSQMGLKLDNEGRIRLPRLDKPITAICKTENDLAAEIQQLYKENYLRDPFVTVNIREQNSQPYSVIGAVTKPGYFVTNRRLTLLELISFAGGPDSEFAGTKIQVARIGGISGCSTQEETNEEGVTFFSYKIDEVVTGKTNPVMRPGDIVFVKKSEQVYVTGNVIKPQPISLTGEMTLTQAIAATGGVLPASKKSKIELVRKVGGVEQKMVLDLSDILDKKIADPVLLPNDIIFVPTDKVKTFLGKALEAVTGGIGNVFYRIPGQ